MGYAVKKARPMLRSCALALALLACLPSPGRADDTSNQIDSPGYQLNPRSFWQQEYERRQAVARPAPPERPSAARTTPRRTQATARQQARPNPRRQAPPNR